MIPLALLCAALMAALVASTVLFLRALRDKDDRHTLIVSGLLNRIQAPEATVLQTLADDSGVSLPALPTHDGPGADEEYWKEVERMQKEADTRLSELVG